MATVDPRPVGVDATRPPEVRAAAASLVGLLEGRPPSFAAAVPADLKAQLAAAGGAIAAEGAQPTNAARLAATADELSAATSPGAVAEAMWSAFCPTAVGIGPGWQRSVEELRARRRLHATTPAVAPILPNQVLLTTNVLLTAPVGGGSALPAAEAAAAKIAATEPAQAFFDHPIPLDTPPDHHELAYGLLALDQAMAVERERGIIDGPVPVVLSLSTTHRALDSVARQHVARMLHSVPLHNLEIYGFAEQDAADLIHAAIGPALPDSGAMEQVARVFGVRGSYGRHYTFLKAIAPLWSLLVDDSIRATFKIDLDQVFPQDELLAATGRSALQLLTAPLWGGIAHSASGEPLALDFVAGSLVNESDIGRGIHVPDVPRPGPPSRPEDFIFYPTLPQALSTEAEMMPDPTGAPRQRVHVTGGTTGATVAGIRRYRPFSPIFWGRAEDQAFGLSFTGNPTPATLHLDDLVMRHDKASFAGEAIAVAAVDKLIGDYERTLLFSAYARSLDPDLESLPAKLAPFTGAFVSSMPVTVAVLRLIITTLSWESDGNADAARLLRDGIHRLDSARRFTEPGGAFATELDADRRGWDTYYDALETLADAVATGEGWAHSAAARGRDVVSRALIGAG